MASSGPPSGAQSGITSDDLVFYIDMALVGILGVATLVYLPRTIARYAHKSGRTEGWLLLQGKQSNQYPRKQAASKSEASVREKEPTSPRTTHQYPPNQPNLGDLSAPTISSTMHAGSTTTIRARLLASNKGRQLGAPPAHIPSLRSFVPLAGKFLDYHIAGYSIRQLTILSVYLAIICIAMFYQSNPKTNTNRAGFVVMSQMPVAFALGTKNSVITILTGISYEQLNFVHRWVGQLMFLASLFHFVGKLVTFTELGIVSIAVSSHSWGVVAFSALCLLAVGSHPWFRARVYGLFFYSHIIGLITFMIGMWKHQPEVAPPYVATCIVIYAADQVTRLVKTRVRKAILTPVPELGSTHVYVPRLDKGWVAGQHVRIRVLSFGVGLFGWAECHPFTIANSSSDAPEGLTLVCKRAGDWTSALYRMANNKSNSEEHRSAYVLIEGPYGKFGRYQRASSHIEHFFSGVMLVLGGSGITFGTSVLEDIIAKKASGAARAMCINFVWAIQHPSAADPYLSTFVEIVQRAADIPDLRLSVSVFYTRGADNAYSLKTRLPPNVQIKSGRPDLLEELSSVLDRTQHAISMHQSPKNGVILAACGPDQLISSVYAAKSGAPSEAQRSVGGLELHTETFGW
ncbi:Ferric reductase like transmembrane component [Rhizoctonia solani]|uniref:ferric-chelate reductase (NADPH) n=2 Tax=Rhizoctonia solani TaxID=456999 RepID=A0A8H8P5A9_9AGAM|nr:Ferric reductase like transmembrane component [Rhizoctonia solani]QRW25510.1 Ferric reductase like transmembrane component [Rhizoctonia solani]